MTTTQLSTLSQCEDVIERGLQTFVDVGNALLRIREGKFYKETHGTFEAYCKDRWGWARSTAYQFIDAARVTENVRHGGQSLPTTERQARPLTRLKDPDQQREAWGSAVEASETGQHRPSSWIRIKVRHLSHGRLTPKAPLDSL